MNIIIAPWARPMRIADKLHPKDYPRWPEVVGLLQHKGHRVIQVGKQGEKMVSGVSVFYRDLTLEALAHEVWKCDTWISVDSFFQHFCWDLNKPGVCIFGVSDPLIFGHPENVNLLKDRKYLREKQFWLWEQADRIDESFVDPEAVVDAVESIISTK
jgi:ADP-heptose:LPS heptosyltransferase